MKFCFNICILFILLLASCHKEENKDIKEKLLGSWDSYRALFPSNVIEGPVPWLLCCYEQGFEIFADGTYRSRYINPDDPSLPMITSADPRLKGSWIVSKDTISFIHTNDMTISKFQFLIARLYEDEMIIKYPFAEYPVYYLRKR